MPLNWNSTGSEREDARAAVAIARLPAKVPVTHPNYGGIILINPGGPGESGIDQVISRGRSIQAIVDATYPPADVGSISDTGSRYFDIVGFDPRGVKYTTPSLDCFPDAFSQQMWLLTRTDFGSMFESNASLGMEWARMEALGRSCSLEGDRQILRYTNTPQVVEDMLAIVEAHGEWRQRTAENTLAVERTSKQNKNNQISERSRWQRGKEMLHYWGVSYGSLLGQTFATMHPERVGRMVIDGVLDPDDYYQGNWLKNLQDSDRVLKKLCEYCHKAGPSKCPVYTGYSGKDIKAMISKVLLELKKAPVVVPPVDPSTKDPIVVTFDDYYLRVINAMAFPYSAAEDVFRLLGELIRGNVTEIARSKQVQLDNAASLAKCRGGSEGCMTENYFGILGSDPVIECMDSAPYRDGALSKEDFWSYFSTLTEQSRWFSLSWARHRMSCIGITDLPEWHYEGKIEGDTSHPLLIIGNTHDTVTPLANAQRVSTLFPGSVVLQQDSEGHCSHANPSSCTALHVRQYFQTGKLPRPETVCQPDYLPFIGDLSRLDDGKLLDDDRLGKALVNLASPLSHRTV